MSADIIRQILLPLFLLFAGFFIGTLPSFINPFGMSGNRKLTIGGVIYIVFCVIFLTGSAVALYNAKADQIKDDGEVRIKDITEALHIAEKEGKQNSDHDIIQSKLDEEKDKSDSVMRMNQRILTILQNSGYKADLVLGKLMWTPSRVEMDKIYNEMKGCKVAEIFAQGSSDNSRFFADDVRIFLESKGLTVTVQNRYFNSNVPMTGFETNGITCRVTIYDIPIKKGR